MSKMHLLVKRIFNCATYCISHVYFSEDGENWQYFCDAIEDTDRGLDQSMSLDEIKSKKVYAKTAIPTGTYKVTWVGVGGSRIAKKYGHEVAWVMDVPGYSGIMIHRGNDEDDSAGCLILGQNKVKGKVINSKITETKFHDKFIQYPRMTITYTRTYKV